jgi:hypothetical protein
MTSGTKTCPQNINTNIQQSKHELKRRQISGILQSIEEYVKRVSTPIALWFNFQFVNIVENYNREVKF